MSSAATHVGLLVTKATVGCSHLQEAEAVRLTHPILQTRTLVTGSGRRVSGSAPRRHTIRPRWAPIARVSGPGRASWSLARGSGLSRELAGGPAVSQPAGSWAGGCLPDGVSSTGARRQHGSHACHLLSAGQAKCPPSRRTIRRAHGWRRGGCRLRKTQLATREFEPRVAWFPSSCSKQSLFPPPESQSLKSKDLGQAVGPRLCP